MLGGSGEAKGYFSLSLSSFCLVVPVLLMPHRQCLWTRSNSLQLEPVSLKFRSTLIAKDIMEVLSVASHYSRHMRHIIIGDWLPLAIFPSESSMH